MQRIVSLAMLFALVLIPAMGFAQSQNSQSLNQQVAQAIADKLSDKYPDYTINVRYNSGTATLGGELYSKDQVDEAVSYVQSLPGVNKVINTLKVVQQRTQIEALPMTSRNVNNVVHQAVSDSPGVQSVPQQTVALQSSSSNVITQVSGRQQMQGAVDFSQPIPSAATPPAPPVTAPVAPVPSLEQSTSVPMPMLTPAPTVQVGYVESSQDVAGGTSYSPPFNNSISISTDQDVQYAPQPQYSGYSPIPMNGNMPLPMGQQAPTAGRYDQPNVPNYAWPTYAAPNNYSEVTYPRLYCPQAAPYIGPFYPYPQVPLEWRKVTLEWHDGYWWLDFDDGTAKGPFSPLFRQPNPKRY